MRNIPTPLIGLMVYENELFQVFVGPPPASRDVPSPAPAYLCINKHTGVIEETHHILFHIKQWADHFQKIMKEGIPEAPVQEAQMAMKFN